LKQRSLPLFQSFASLQLVESTVSPSQSNKRISGEIHPSATQAQLWEGSGAQGQGKEPQGKPRAAVRALPVLRAAPPQPHPEGHSLHLLADVGAEGDVRLLCAPLQSLSQTQGFQGVCTSSFCAEQELSAHFKQQLSTSGASTGQEPVQPPAGAGNWGDLSPSVGRAARLLGKPG
uniref:Uncharacterized protein n=1 Tax=Serinus canaria TaxID=9135 RepID=A0A8C9NW49_SERCA